MSYAGVGKTNIVWISSDQNTAFSSSPQVLHSHRGPLYRSGESSAIFVLYYWQQRKQSVRCISSTHTHTHTHTQKSRFGAVQIDRSSVNRVKV